MKKQYAVSLVVLLLLLVTQAYAGNNEESDNIKQLREIGKRCLDFAQDNNGKLPPDLATLHYKAYVNRLKFFTSPATEKGVMERTKIDEKSDYVLSYQAQAAPAKESLISEKKGASSTREHIQGAKTAEVSNVKTEMDIGSGQPRETGITKAAPTVPDSGDAIPVIQDRSAVNNGGKGVYVFYSDESIRLKSGEVVSVARPTMERPKLEQPTAERPTMERPTMERPLPERTETERPLPDRPTREIPVVERPKPERPESERPIPDKRSFDDYKKEQDDAYKKWLEQRKESQ
jgi:hypothetical protein